MTATGGGPAAADRAAADRDDHDPDDHDPEVPIRRAATVVLLRDGASGIEAWLLTRVTQMTFAAGMSVFPGGRVDEDTDLDVPLSGADGPDLAARFGCPEPAARALVAAAARELFEETGVLLTDAPADLAGRREDVEEGRIGFGALLVEHGLAVDASALHPWARWVTPKGEVRRYDTYFFVCALPAGAVARDVTSESSTASWLSIGGALDEGARGVRQLLPPTAATLATLQRFDTVADAIATSSARDLTPVRPKLTVADDGSLTVTLPGGEVLSIPRGMAK